MWNVGGCVDQHFCKNLFPRDINPKSFLHEWYVHGQRPWSDMGPYSYAIVSGQITRHRRTALSGNNICAMSWCDDTSSPTANNIHRWQKCYLASFLMSVVHFDRSWIAWQFHESYSHRDYGYYPEMDYEWGEPLDATFNVYGGTNSDVYWRTFENYYVVVNLSKIGRASCRERV